ncbi:MAG: TM0996/MTH895 family glutaredoxin-like protein [Verrucomicrobiales bacterium]|nr:TM0996/MTH895 family glutaredoxin-like protein [Verrucomicrobiales bacterium]
MQLLVLGPGCTKCKKLAEATDLAARELGLEYQLSKVTDLNQILALRVMMTPALVVDGTVKVTGRVPTVEELKQILVAARPQPSAA